MPRPTSLLTSMQTEGWVKGMHAAISANCKLNATQLGQPLIDNEPYRSAFKTAQRLVDGEKGKR